MSQPDQDASPVQSVDLTGVQCPLTFVKAKLHLEQMATGEAVEFIVMEGEPMRDVPRSLKDEGHRIEHVRKEQDRYRLLVRKGP